MNRRRTWGLGAAAICAIAGAIFGTGGCTTTGQKDTPTNTKTPRAPTNTPVPTSTPAFPSPTPWSTPGSGYVVVFGGETGGSVAFSDVLVAPIQAGGTLGAWTMSPNPIPSPLGSSLGITCAMWAVKWAQPTPWVIYGNPAEPGGAGYSFSNLIASAPGAGPASGTGPWVEGTPIANAQGTPIFAVWAGAVTDNSRIYTVEADSGTGCGVSSGAIAGGAVASWSISSNCTGVDLNNFPMVAGNGYVFTLGGRNGTGIIADVYRAPVSSAGAIGAWASVGQLPQPTRRAPQQAVAVPLPGRHVVYLAGGFDNSATLSTVLKAEIDAFGNLGTWSTTTALPGPLEYGSLVSYQSGGQYYLAVIGGSDGSAEISSCYTAQISASTGAVGAWSSAPPLPSPREMVAAVVF